MTDGDMKDGDQLDSRKGSNIDEVSAAKNFIIKTESTKKKLEESRKRRQQTIRPGASSNSGLALKRMKSAG
jgi:hypothetical protein